MMYVQLFVPMAVFVMLVAITSLICRLIGMGMVHKTIREAMRSEPGAIPSLVERLDRPAPWGDALLGWIFLALAAAIALFAVTETDEEARIDLLRGTIIPIVVGVVVLIYARWTARHMQDR
jgi:NhaP-type Na+/H+ or K+/H+ antiporter